MSSIEKAADPVAALASARFSARIDPRALPVDRASSGAVARLGPGDRVRRLEPGPCGPLLLEVTSVRHADARRCGTEVTVWGSPDTPEDQREEALGAAVGWAGLTDDPAPLADAVAGHHGLSTLLAAVGPVRLSRLPRVIEALGRAVLEQLIQTVEAKRSIAQLVAVAGTPGPAGLHAWPTARQISATPSWILRRCGVSLRGARALHAGAVDETRLSACGSDWVRLHARLMALPGVGVWTSAQVRLALGDPDAVPVGDYNLPGLIGHVLAGDRDADDAAMLDLLAPFASQRGRVIELIKAGVARRVVRGPARRAPRAALSAHRYW